VTAERLAIWLYGTRVALIEADRQERLRLWYTDEALAAFDLGTPLLSIRLPLTGARYGTLAARAFLDGLLPEGEPRRVIAEDLRLRADDTFALVGALGRDCAGALVIQPDGEPAPPPATVLAAEPLTPDELTRLVANLRSAPLGIDRRVRVSLAGVQEKLLLTRRLDGSWGRPAGGTPSTHILKPEIQRFPETVANEAFCMRLAADLGLPVPEVDTLTTTGGHTLIVVSRYDRRVDASGLVERLHQEDLCQATGTMPRQKYQEDGGPSLRRIAEILRAVDPGSLPRLLQAATLNVLIGNGDAHGKNFSLLHERSGALGLAPLYDLMSTLAYGDDTLAMSVGGIRQMTRVTREAVVGEAITWGMPGAAAARLVDDLVARAPEAVGRAGAQAPGVPVRVRDAVAAQIRNLRRRHHVGP
jgi:serine/threonine-protein kinase HipA